jgi:hypothetical protein
MCNAAIRIQPSVPARPKAPKHSHPRETCADHGGGLTEIVRQTPGVSPADVYHGNRNDKPDKGKYVRKNKVLSMFMKEPWHYSPCPAKLAGLRASPSVSP